jgi:translation initiation factor IF-3
LVGPNGEQVGIVRVEDALRLAAEADLDLVEVAPMAKPPVAKLMDFGKFKYEAAMKAREARKNQVNTVIKEIKLRPKIDPHDYGTKKGHVERFLKGGDKVKVTIMFRGREQSRPELGYRLLQRLAQDILELGTVESAPKQDGRNMVMVIAPTKKKAQAMAEQRRRRDEGGNASASTSASASASAGSSAAVDSIEAEVLQAQAFEAEVVETEAAEATAPEVEVVEEAAPEPEVVETPAPVAAVVETPVETKPSAAPKPMAAPAPKAPAPKAPAPKATPKPRAAPKPKA